MVADENADFTETNLDCAIRLVDGPGDLQGIELDEARRVTVARPGDQGGAPDQWSGGATATPVKGSGSCNLVRT